MTGFYDADQWDMGRWHDHMRIAKTLDVVDADGALAAKLVPYLEKTMTEDKATELERRFYWGGARLEYGRTPQGFRLLMMSSGQDGFQAVHDQIRVIDRFMRHSALQMSRWQRLPHQPLPPGDVF